MQQFCQSSNLLVGGLGVVDLHLAVRRGERNAIGDDLVVGMLHVGFKPQREHPLWTHGALGGGGISIAKMLN